MALRSTNLEKLAAATEPFDVLVVGAGINGAVSAAALAARGASVALVDRGDFAGFTSQESSNLVWGGFKYLEHYEIGLVRDLCKSRNRLLRAYPANIKPIRFLAALDRNAPYAPWFAGVGAAAYWAIGNGMMRPPRVLSPERVARVEPAIDTTGLRGALMYSDAYLVDNDTRFVFGFVRAALNVGAVAANYVELTAAEQGADRTWRCTLRDVDGDAGGIEVSARVVVNAAGPFADTLNAQVGVTGNQHRIVLSKGIHLVVPRIANAERVLAFFDDTQRLFYVIPMGPRSVIGTTDTRVDDPHTEVTPEDRAFVLEQINARLRLPQPLTEADIISERCGVRPLAVDRGEGNLDEVDWTSLSRRHHVDVDDERAFVTIYGGKLTDCLNLGEEVCDAAEHLGIGLARDRKDWYGEPPKATAAEFERQARLMRLDRLRKRASFETLTTRLWRRYGLRAFALLEAMRDDPSMADEVIEGAEYLRCELYGTASTEMITRLDDFLRRRSKIAMVMSAEDIRTADGMDEACDILFGPDAARRRAEYFAGT